MKYFLIFFLLIPNLWAQPCPEFPINDLFYEEEGFLKDKGCKESVKPFGTKSPAALRVVWWNVQYNFTGSNLNNELGINPLQENINSMLQADVDFIALGEWEEHVLTDKMKSLIQENFPYTRFVQYNKETKKSGIYILSKLPFESFSVDQLDWAPNEKYRQDWQSNFENTKRLERPYIQVKLKHNGKNIILSPVHLNQPWSRFINREIPFEAINTIPFSPVSGEVGNFLERITNTVDTALRVQLGVDTPLSHQLEEMSQYRESSDIIFGDFNFPKNLLPIIPTVLYQKAKGELRDLASDQKPSYPTHSSQKGGRSLRIDQAFAREELNVSSANRSCLTGSDHYPIFFEVN